MQNFQKLNVSDIMIVRDEYTIKIIDEYINNKLYQFEVESKGCFFGVIVETKTQSFELSFYDTTRFKQDIDDELECVPFVYNYNIVFLEKVTLNNIVNSIDRLWTDKIFDKIIPE